MKKCCRCKQIYPVEEYGKDKSRKDGLTAACKACRSEDSRRKYLLNSEREKKRAAEWAKANPERVSENRKSWYLQNKEAALAKSNAHYQENKEKRKAQMRAWYAANKSVKNQKSRQWAKENPGKVAISAKATAVRHRDKKSAYEKLWREANPHIRAASSAKRRAAKRQRTPDWLTDADLQEMKAIYARAAELTEATGNPHHVDHILPLMGKFVSGLHVPSNLQILTAIENCQKHNTWRPS